MYTVGQSISLYCGFISIHSNGIPKTSWNIEYELREIAKAYNSLYPECQLPNLTPHVLRHTFCTRKVSSGMNIKAVQYLMGHSSVQITLDVYTSIDADMIKTEFAKVAQMWELLHQLLHQFWGKYAKICEDMPYYTAHNRFSNTDNSRIDVIKCWYVKKLKTFS